MHTDDWNIRPNLVGDRLEATLRTAAPC